MVKFLAALNHLAKTVLSLAIAGLLAGGAWFGYQIYFKDELQQDTIADQADQLRAQQTALANKDQAIQELETDLGQRDQELADSRREIATKDAHIEDQVRTIESQANEITAQGEQIAEQQEEIQRLNLAMRFLKVNRRVARLTVLDIRTGDDGKIRTKVEFAELDPEGGDDPRMLDKPRIVEIIGDTVYVEAWVVKFDDKFIESGDDPLRATSLCLFRRIYGEGEKVEDAAMIDPEGKRPYAYGRGRISEFESDLWSNFWDYAKDRVRQKEAGLRSVHGEAVFTKAIKDKSYTLELRASGGLEISPPQDAPPRRAAPTAPDAT